MTTVPGFNLLIQQSGIVREMNPTSGTPNPEPGQAAGELVANEEAKKTIIQETEEPEKLKSKKDRDQKNKSKEKRKKKKEELNEEDNPDSTGRLLDTIV